MSIVLPVLALVALQQSPYAIDYLQEPSGEVLEVGGMAFMADGDMVVSTRRGQVWRISNPEAENPQDASFILICEGLHEGLGLATIDDEIFVMQRGEISKLVDVDGDEIIDEIQTITQDWGLSGNYHEFGFGLPVDKEGNMYFSLNVGFWNPHWWHGKSRAPYRGWVLQVTPDGTVTPIAGGLRSPAGMGFLEDGTLLVTDNQGDWMAVCPVYAIKEGAFYGHPASLRWYEDQPDIEPSDTQPPAMQREHPALWLPYQWSRSTGNVIQDNTGGPFNGQYYIAELTNGQILRAAFEEIDGVLQGACWQAHKHVGSSYHIEFGPDGTLYSGMTNRGWGGLAPGSGIARIKYNGKLPLDMTSAHLVPDGFEITFTKPLAKAPEVHGQKYDYNYWWEYGSPKQHIEDLIIPHVTLSEDGLSAKVTIDNLEAGKCVMLTLSNTLATDGSSLLNKQMSYTINKMPGGELQFVAKQTEPPVERGERVEGWLYLTWADAFDMWQNNGVELCNAELDVSNPAQFAISEGMVALVASEGESMLTTFIVHKGEIKMKYMLAKDSEAEIRLPNGGTVHLADSQDGGYLGAGIWHDLRIIFSTKPAEITLFEINSVPMPTEPWNSQGIIPLGPIEITCTKGHLAFGDVRFRLSEELHYEDDWVPLRYNDVNITTSGSMNWRKTDAGELVLHGNGTATLPTSGTWDHIRFDVKIQGLGNAVIKIGELEVDVATQGDRKTGGITGHPIHANLVDQNEWCTILIRQEHGKTTLLLNGTLLFIEPAPSMQGGSIDIELNDAELFLRRTYIK